MHPPQPEDAGERRRPVRRFVVALVAAAAVLFAGLHYSARHHARSMMEYSVSVQRTPSPEDLTLPQKIGVLFRGVRVPRPESPGGPGRVAPRARSMRIPAPDGVTLEAWYHGQGPAAPLVLMFHGYAASKTSLLEEARVFGELGCSVLLVDFRGSGGSSESITTIGVLESRDVAAAADYARVHCPHGALLLYGQSMGAAAVLRAVDKHGVTADGLILEAVFDTMLNTVANRFEAMGLPAWPAARLLVFWGGRRGGFDARAHNPAAYVRAADCPILFMHGSEDPRASLQEALRVYRQAPSEKRFVRFEGAGHEPCLNHDPQRWKDAVSNAIRRALLRDAP